LAAAFLSEATMKFFRLSRLLVPVVAATCLMASGCATRVYGPPPPPPPNAAPVLVQEAETRGFRAGEGDGARDLANGSGYHPKRDRKFADTPGYDPRFGPFPPYRDYFRNAYLRGYYKGFYRK
jgi:hypothetical protein